MGSLFVRSAALSAALLALACERASAPSEAPEPVATAGALPPVRVEAVRVALPEGAIPVGAHAVGLIAINDTDEPVRVGAYVEVLHYPGGGDAAESYEGVDVLVRDGCAPMPATDPLPCVTLEPRSRRTLAPWLGVRHGVGQCGVCDSSVPREWDASGCDLAPGGAHAFRLWSCEHGPLSDGPRFELPEPAPRAPVELCVAAAAGEIERVRALASDRAQRACALPVSFEPRGRARSSALMLAAMYGHLEVVRVLLAAGLDPLERDPESGRSAYVHACAGNHIDVVDALWEAGVRPLPDDPHIGAVLWSAATHGRREILEHYASEGADLDADHFGVTPLEAAERADRAAIASWLRAHGAGRR